MTMMIKTKISTITLITTSQNVMLILNTSTMSRTSTRMKIKTFKYISFIFSSFGIRCDALQRCRALVSTVTCNALWKSGVGMRTRIQLAKTQFEDQRSPGSGFPVTSVDSGGTRFQVHGSCEVGE